jgi:hypothetical protein
MRNLTNLIDDIRQFNSKDELVASGTALYESLAVSSFLVSCMARC